MFEQINYLREADINKTPIQNIKKIIKDDYISHIYYLLNNNLTIDEKDIIHQKIKELRIKENIQTPENRLKIQKYY